MTDTTNAIPNPGSDEAIAKGCTCPVMDNNHGAGISFGVEKLYWYTDGCPLHCPDEKPISPRTDK